MIIDISDNQFKRICENTELHLPLRWDGKDYIESLKMLYNLYIDILKGNYDLKRIYSGHISLNVNDIKSICEGIVESVEAYLNGFPSIAFERMGGIMRRLIKTPLKIYEKSSLGDLDDHLNFFSCGC